MKQYKLLVGETNAALAAEVNNHLGSGWKVQGSPGWSGIVFFQAIIK